MKAAVIGIVFRNERKEVLTLKRRDVPIWVLPGGGIDPHETPEDAVIREVKEETGLDVTLVRKTAEYSSLNSLTGCTHAFECQVKEGTPLIGSETKDVAFHPTHHLPRPFFPLHRDWIEDALNEKHLIQKPTQASYGRALLFLCRHPYLTFRYLLARIGFPVNS